MPPGELAAPSTIVVEEFTYLEGQNHKFGAIISWQHADDARVSYYEIQIKGVAVDLYEKLGAWERGQSLIRILKRKVLKGE